jgi:phosphate-selective porin OprO/OprP
VHPVLARISVLAFLAQALPAQETAPAPQPLVGYDDGFFARTADGSARLTLGGLLQVNGNFFEPDLGGRESEFFLRRMRFEIGGAFDERYLFNVEPKFTEDDVDLEEAWIGADLAEGGPRLYLGRMKEPFSLEELIPLKHIDLVNLSLLNQFVPAEQNGATLYGRTPDGRIEYGAAYYTGDGTDDIDSERGGAARCVLHPFATAEDSPLRGFQVGVASTLGRAGQDISGDELITEARVQFLSFEPGSSLDGRRWRAGAEAAWLRGPFALYGEGMISRQEMEGASGEENVAIDGLTVATSYVLTGEEKTFRGVRPRRPFRPGGGEGHGAGAFQVAARFSLLTLDDDLVDAGIVAASSYPRHVRSVEAGLNWYATYHARVKLHYLRTEYGRDIVIGGDERGSEDAILVQFQLNF